jgi:hypothetical protein
MALKTAVSIAGALEMLVNVTTALYNTSFCCRGMRSIKSILLLPLGESETITSSVLTSIAKSMFLVVALIIQFMGFQCKWHRPLALFVLFLHRVPFFVVPVHWVATDPDFVRVELPSQQSWPTFLSCTLQKQLFDLLRLHFIQSNWTLEASLLPPQEKGII